MQDNFTDDMDVVVNDTESGDVIIPVDNQDEETIRDQAEDMVNEEELDIYLCQVELEEQQLDKYEKIMSDLKFCAQLTASDQLTTTNAQVLTEQAGFVDIFGTDPSLWHGRIQNKLAEISQEAIVYGPVGDAIDKAKRTIKVAKRLNAVAAKKKAKEEYDQKVAEAEKFLEEHKKKNPPKMDPEVAKEKTQEYEVGKSNKKPRARPKKTPKVEQKDVDQLEEKQEQAEASAEQSNKGEAKGPGVIEVTGNTAASGEEKSEGMSKSTGIILIISAIVILGAVAVIMWMRSFRYIRMKLSKIAGLEQPETIMNNNAPALVPPVIAKGALDFLKKNFPIVEGQFNDVTKYPVEKVEALTKELNGYSARVKRSGGTLISKVFRNATPFAMGWKYEELVDLIDGVVDMVDKVTPLLTRPPARPIVIQQNATQVAVAKVQLKLSKKLVRAYLNLLRLLGRGVAQVAE